MAEPAQPRIQPSRAARRRQSRVSGEEPLRPWRAAGVPLPEWLASLEDDPPPGEDMIPMIEPHAEAMCYTREAFVHRFRAPSGDGPQGEVGFDLPVTFHLQGERGKQVPGRLSPDVLVAFGAPHDPARREFDADQLGAPDFVLEVLSKSTWKRDVDAKLKTYAAIGVRECFLFDPTGRFPVPGLQGYALTKTRVDRLPTTRLANGAEGVYSPLLGLVAYIKGDSAPSHLAAQAIRWHDPAMGAALPTYSESQAEVGRAEAEAGEAKIEADRAKVAAGHAKAEAEEAKAEVKHAKAEAEEAKAEVKHAKAEAEEAKAEVKHAKAEAEEAKVEAEEAKRRIAELEARVASLTH